ncbi:hypothetical protein SOCEGT47_044530 [Sorangium cellulosum]|uniref:Secreted protein n=1 Tax=Sorangium cellulosum TaxID=56 RepID=A0A4P2Q4R5_SORCE|nr:hypothetical protein [Sorangium cellulosum]AUX23923.1 hypothetical protein SOCEGT47_044530 [Sorangium cellulosum]
MKPAIVLPLVVVSSCIASAAAAAEQACGYSSAGWNAPNGAAVFSAGSGPIGDVLNAVGELRTHSMLSHGAGRWVTHATMKQPTENSWPAVCSTPITPSDLIGGYPGLEQVNQGGIYRFLYGSGGGGATALTYQVGDPKRAASIGDHIWYTVPYYTDRSIVDGGAEIARPQIRGGRVPYSFYQYRTTEGTPTGEPAWNNGMVCSSFLAYAHYADGQGVIPPYTYNHAKLASAANALHAGVRGDCEQSLGFWGELGTSIVCFASICTEAADQVANCMASHRCDTSSSSLWRGVRDDPSTVAESISPDRIGGWSGHAWGTQAGATVWSADINHNVQWSSPGNVYGCWY